VKLKVIWVGKTQEEWMRAGIEEYSQRVRRYMPLELSEVKEERGAGSDRGRAAESARMKKLLPKNAFLVLCDERGEEFTSPQFAAFINAERDRGAGEMVFAVGGAYGFSDDFRGLAQRTVALSRMTFTHQMVRLFLLEQIYRAFTIINNEPYHH
jgi:23S rRNA (pseudouridine1915-N3)-methyltransferase